MDIINIELIEEQNSIDIDVVEKSNPYRDAKTGRFTNAPGGASYSTQQTNRNYEYISISIQEVKKYMAMGQKADNILELENMIYRNDFSMNDIMLMEIGYRNKDFNVESLKVEKFLRIGEPRELHGRYKESWNYADDAPESGVSVITSDWLHGFKSVFFGAHDDAKLKERGVYEITGIKIPERGGDGEPLIIPIDWAKKTNIKTYKKLEQVVQQLEHEKV